MIYHLSYLNINHGIERPPPRILVFKYPSRERVNGTIEKRTYLSINGESLEIASVECRPFDHFNM